MFGVWERNGLVLAATLALFGIVAIVYARSGTPEHKPARSEAILLAIFPESTLDDRQAIIDAVCDQSGPSSGSQSQKESFYVDTIQKIHTDAILQKSQRARQLNTKQDQLLQLFVALDKRLKTIEAATLDPSIEKQVPMPPQTKDADEGTTK